MGFAKFAVKRVSILDVFMEGLVRREDPCRDASQKHELVQDASVDLVKAFENI